MTHAWRPLSVLDVVWLALGLLMGAGLLAAPDATGDPLGLRRFRTPEISRDWEIAQHFLMNAPDFNALEIRAAAVGPVEGRYRLTVRDRDAENVERSAEIAAADLVANPSYRFVFDPIAASMNHEFQFDITPASTDPGRGVALWATKGPRLAEGGLRINDTPRWASLAFQTHTDAVSPLRGLLTADGPERPPRWLALVALLGQWIALRVVLQAFIAPSRQEDPRPQAAYS